MKKIGGAHSPSMLQAKKEERIQTGRDDEHDDDLNPEKKNWI